ncbi:MAG TPA: molybdopterin converting factor subunit 1 [Beijerinckiaceae bacterium]|nr:molybdopterin converting factor subunit 1 [Beijerinckiaceae bacterium]
MKLVYFAWVRERIGLSEEEVELPADVRTVADLLAWQQRRGERYAHAFEKAPFIRVALDRSHARADQPVTGAREIAFFPPMTGG